MSQTFLDENPPKILDATCSTLKIWPVSATIRMDVRREVKPDLVADAKYLPFRPGTFDIIYCDPPHIIGGTGKEPRFSEWFSSVNRHLYKGENFRKSFFRYGRWKNKDEWLCFIRESQKQFSLCLKPNGVLEYKVSEPKGGTKVRDVLEDKTFILTRQRRTVSKYGHNPTYWLTMRPKS